MSISVIRRSLAIRSLGLILAAGGLLALSLSPVKAQQGGQGLLLVSNKGDHTLSLVDPTSHEQIATIDEEGVTGHEVCASLDGKLAFVPIFGSGGVGTPGTDGQFIRVMDLAQRKIVHTIDFGRGVRPHCPIPHPKSGDIYVTTENDNTISIIDGKTFAIKGSIPTGEVQTHMLTLSNDGKRGYTSNVGPGTVSVLDLEKGELLKVIPVCRRTQRIAVSNDDKWVFTSDQFFPQLAVIDAEKLEVAHWIKLPGIGYGADTTPDGKKLIIALVQDNKVAEIDLEKREVTRTLDVPKAPQAVVVRPDGAYAYVSCDATAQIAAINLKDWKVEKLIPVGKTADGLAWAPGK